MRKILEYSKYLVLIAVVSTLVASVATFLLGAYKTVIVLIGVFSFGSAESFSSVSFLQLMDTLLIAVVLLVFSTGLYGLFIKELGVSRSLKTKSLHELEAKLGSLVILVMALYLLERFIQWENTRDLLFMAAAFALVSAALIAYRFLGRRAVPQKPEKRKR